MAGTFIKVEVKGGTIAEAAFARLARQADNLSPALADVGEFLVESTQQRFVDQQAPDGTPWPELSSVTLERKKRGDRILTESGTLADTIHYQLFGDLLQVGSNQEYAAIHQFGGVTSAKSMFGSQEMPQREFLGIAPFEEQEVADIITAHLQAALYQGLSD
ncbi:phage virion morphogenesis protein [Shewanella sp. WXL01]|uniref:phage virion morphogenesis protein n=1 Tax=Shewanella sp. WXL01 TaxID=2709721 RepID=UPI00143837DC|nr:phage virion morphogenesis protein [Shewanella sp. WXL01]NKF51370.1 phage virion morphogenesis protein [Shewanella sp. WXL01]